MSNQQARSGIELRNAWLLAYLAVLAVVAVLLIWRFDPGRWPISVCGLHASTGLHCPGCGATRATHELLHGRIRSALGHNALWVLALPLAVYVGLSEVRQLADGRPLPGNLTGRPAFWIGVAVVATIFAVLRNIPAWPFVLLAPPV